ncbi:MAG: 4-phosphoerythronate dehydrogenase [Mariprofundus sp.]|nr:4-phosphoerythronate dehydrogenase [Mariprofundus sp.]
MSPVLNIIADAHIWGVESAFSELSGFDVNLQLMENKHITSDTVHDADILLTRSATRVNADLLQGSSVRFAATATIGDDHYDKTWLNANSIAWANAAGSSTDSVIEYMITTLLDLHIRGLISIPDTCIGIIGVGRIGSKLANICEALGMIVLRNDPPRARNEGTDIFCPLDQLLEQADILTLHTPLLHDGMDCTIHLLGSEQLSRFKGKGIINAGRGACVDNPVLCNWLDNNVDRFAVLDCWENEPAPLPQLLKHPGVAIATPHIAGHSLEGKAANTAFIYHALCKFLCIHPVWKMLHHLPQAPAPAEIQAGKDPWQNLHAAATALYPIAADNQAMRSWNHRSASELAKSFTSYRRQYPPRRGWLAAPVYFTHTEENILKLAQIVGMVVMLDT